MIFWRQSAGRMVQSFSHRQPIWFYVPVLLVSLGPLLVRRPLWRNAPGHPGNVLRKASHLHSGLRIVPALVFFTVFSGKQTPLCPALPAGLPPFSLPTRSECGGEEERWD